MSFNWKDYIRLAEDLIKYNKEAYFRSGISRAYYGVFCLSRNKAGFKDYRFYWNYVKEIKKNYKNKNRHVSVHEALVNYYESSKDPKEQSVGKILDELRKNRNDADYNEDKVIDFRLAQRVLLKSKEILKELGIVL